MAIGNKPRLHWHQRLHLVPVLVLGLALVYIGERSFNDFPRVLISWVGIGFVAVGAVVGWLRRKSESDPSRRMLARDIMFHCLGVLAALGVYGWSVWKGGAWGDRQAELVSVLWPTLVAFACLPAIFLEFVWHGALRTPVVESWKPREARRSALIILLALVTFASLNYWASQKNRSIDLSYFKAAQVGPNVTRLLEGLESPLEVTVAYPPVNEVRESVLRYVEQMKTISPKVAVRVIDRDAEPRLARELRIDDNGKLLLQYRGGRELIFVGLKMERAAQRLREIDREIHGRLVQLTNPNRRVYVTKGHGERKSARTADNPRPAVENLKSFMQDLGYQYEELGFAEGLGTAIPEDAAALVMVGPTEELNSESVAVINDYLSAGGRVLLAVDPDEGSTQDGLLKDFGIKVSEGILRAERPVRRGLPPIIGPMRRFGSHAATKILAAAMRQRDMVPWFWGAGTIDFLEDELSEDYDRPRFVGFSPDFMYLDKNGDGEMNAESGETLRARPVLSVSAGRPGTPAEDGRLVVVTDSWLLSDQALVNGEEGPSQLFAFAMLKWLVEDLDEVLEDNTELDQKLVLRREEDGPWFWGTTLGVPGIVTMIGFAVNRRRRRREEEGT